MDLLGKMKALPRPGHGPVRYSEDQSAKVKDRNLKNTVKNINNAGCRCCIYFIGALVFVSGRQSVELWLCSRPAGKPEPLPNEAAYAKKKRKKNMQGH